MCGEKIFLILNTFLSSAARGHISSPPTHTVLVGPVLESPCGASCSSRATDANELMKFKT